MAARDCRLLVDIIPDIQSLVDQPANDPSQLAFPPDQFVRAVNNAQDELFRLAWSLDSDWTTVEAILAVAAGSTWVELPDDCRAVRSTIRWNSSTNRKVSELACGEWSQLGVRDYDCLFKPKDHEHDNKATLRFMRPAPVAFDMKVVYDYWPIRLAHGTLPIDSGALSTKLQDYEPTESNRLTGLNLYITSDPAGNGAAAGQMRPIDSWTGPTRTAGLAITIPSSAWSPIPKKGATYTSGPDIPRDWEQFFIFQSAVFLGIKLPERIVQQWQQERERLEIRAKHQAATMDRRAAKIVRSRSITGPGFQGDPINRPGGW